MVWTGATSSKGIRDRRNVPRTYDIGQCGNPETFRLSPSFPVVGTGQTMKQTQAQVYSRIKNILIPNMYYRTDVGDRWAEDSDKLHNWGYLR